MLTQTANISVSYISLKSIINTNIVTTANSKAAVHCLSLVSLSKQVQLYNTTKYPILGYFNCVTARLVVEVTILKEYMNTPKLE